MKDSYVVLLENYIVMNSALNIVELGESIAGIFESTFCDTKPEDIIDILGVQNKTTLIARGFGFLSIFKINGYYGSVGQDEYTLAHSALLECTKNRLEEDSSHLIKIVFESDPDAISEFIDKSFEGSRAHLKSLNLDLEDLLIEKRDAVAKYSQKETCYCIFYTFPKSKNEHKVESIDGVSTGSSSITLEAENLLNLHNAAFESIFKSLSKLMYVSVVESDEILPEIYRCINGNASYKKLQFEYVGKPDSTQVILSDMDKLPDRKIPLDASEIVKFAREISNQNNKSLEPLLPPSISEQLISGGCYDTAGGIVVCGSRVYMPLGVSTYGRDIRDFDVLIRSLSRIPFRIAFTIKPDGLATGFIKTMEGVFASIVGLFVKKIKLRNDAISTLNNLKSSHPVPGLSITAATWAPLERKIDEEKGKSYYSTDVVLKRGEKLKAAINDWCSMRAKDCVADSVECLFSTFPGLIGYHVAPTCPVPLSDIIKILPITRPAGVWDFGTSVFRTEDGKVIFYEPMSTDKIVADVTIVSGDMGRGKSSNMFGNNLSIILKPSANGQLPYIRGIDFGYSQSYLVHAIRDGLPLSERHKAVYSQISNSREYAINFFTTLLGSRYPTTAHFDFCVNQLMTATFSIAESPNHFGICQAAVKLAYKIFSDEDGNTHAKRYKKHVDDVVDEHLKRLEIAVEDNITTWWEVTDKLFLSGLPRIASRAQRYAIPTLSDFFFIATSQELTSEYKQSFRGVPICDAFKTALGEVIESIPMLTGPSAVDISDSPIYILDLKDVLHSDSNPSINTQIKNALIFTSVMQLLSSDFFADHKSTMPSCHPMYEDYHFQRIAKIMTSNKRYFIDERHRVKSIKSAVDAIDGLIAEGRKFGVSILQGSQLLSDFSPKSISLATMVVNCGTDSLTEINASKTAYGFTDYHVSLIKGLRPPRREGAEFFVKYTAKKSQYCMKLTSTEGPKHLCMIATNQEDRAVRDGLQQIANSARKAREIFAKEFPEGSVEKEIENRKSLKAAGYYKSPYNDFIKDIIYDLSIKYGLIKTENHIG